MLNPSTLDNSLNYSSIINKQPHYTALKQESKDINKTSAQDALTSKSTLEYQNLFIKYYLGKDYQNSAYYGEKIIVYTPNNIDFLRALAYSYFKIKDYEKSLVYYKKIVQLNPNNKADKMNFNTAKYYFENNKLNDLINKLEVTQNAPEELYRLIKTNLSSDVKNETEGILNVIWNEPNGYIMLQTILNKQVPINIIKSNENAQTNIEYINGKANVTGIYIPVKYINMVNNKELPAEERIYAFHTFMHEFGHAYLHIKDPTCTDSLEEEIGVDIIGYNIAYKIITGNYLTKQQTQTKSLSSLASALNDKHKNLPVYSDFTNHMQQYGIKMPYPDVYANISSMYKKLVALGLTKHVSNLENVIQ